MNRLYFYATLFACLMLSAHARTWTQKKSGSTIAGDFVEFDGNNVKIKVTAGSRKGKTVSISRFDLSQKDRDWLKKKADEYQMKRKVPKHTAVGVEDLEEDDTPEGVDKEVQEKGSNMVMNLGWCVLVLAEFLFIMSGMKSGLFKGVIAAIPGIGWVLFAMMEWQNAKMPFMVGLVGVGIVVGGYTMGGGTLY
jgi:hypothetical protein